MPRPLVLAQGTSDAPAWLQGSLSVPFWAVGLLVGVGILAGLMYFARKFGKTRRERALEDEEHPEP